MIEKHVLKNVSKNDMDRLVQTWLTPNQNLLLAVEAGIISLDRALELSDTRGLDTEADIPKVKMVIRLPVPLKEMLDLMMDADGFKFSSEWLESVLYQYVLAVLDQHSNLEAEPVTLKDKQTIRDLRTYIDGLDELELASLHKQLQV